MLVSFYSTNNSVFERVLLHAESFHEYYKDDAYVDFFVYSDNGTIGVKYRTSTGSQYLIEDGIVTFLGARNSIIYGCDFCKIYRKYNRNYIRIYFPSELEIEEELYLKDYQSSNEGILNWYQGYQDKNYEQDEELDRIQIFNNSTGIKNWRNNCESA
jgi:hypothetical protein